jgi:hypothetical protein
MSTGVNANRSFSGRFGRWAAELLLVFLGAYAAFWLNNYQQHRQEAKRRDQILAALEEEVKEGIESTKTEGAKEDRQATEFKRALDAGEMPPIKPFAFSSDYSASDIASLLQSGGYDLLDVKTLTALRNAESVIRGGLSRMRHYQDLSDSMIYPHLDDDVSFFYDPATKQLRKKFARYPEILQSGAAFFQDMEKAQSDLLKQIQAERQRK